MSEEIVRMMERVQLIKALAMNMHICEGTILDALNWPADKDARKKLVMAFAYDAGPATMAMFLCREVILPAQSQDRTP